VSNFGIYKRPCPACGTLAPTGIDRCECGYAFESDATLPEDLALQEEETFEAYINARADQAIASVESARAILAADPKNTDKAASLLKTVQQALILRDERDAQAIKIAEAKQIALAAHAKLNPAGMDSSAAVLPETDVATAPPEAFKAQQADRAKKIMQAFANTQTRECPCCHTILPVTSALCLCGYHFERHEVLWPSSAERPSPKEPFDHK
jgi:hypothetical protein